ncbi:MAG: hypothetical protein JJT85_10765 [Chromatiales bacterium]|nr:hypothetical protein [Chromatiales bacterium]
MPGEAIDMPAEHANPGFGAVPIAMRQGLTLRFSAADRLALGGVLCLYVAFWPLVSGEQWFLQWVMNATLLLMLLAFVFAAGTAIPQLRMTKVEWLVACCTALLSLWMMLSELVRLDDPARLVRALTFLAPVFILVLAAIDRTRPLIAPQLLMPLVLIAIVVNAFFTFVMSAFDQRLGKFDGVVPGFTLSSNSLSIYLVMSVVVPAWMYYAAFRKNLLAVALISLLPLAHFSKIHLVAYVAAFVLAYAFVQRQMLKVALLLLAGVALFVVLGAYAAELSALVPDDLQRSVGRVVLGLGVFHSVIVEGTLYEPLALIGEIGDPRREWIYSVLLANLGDFVLFGWSSTEQARMLGGADVHSTFIWLAAGYGFLGPLLFTLALCSPALDWRLRRAWRFILLFVIAYFMFRGIFISYDPVRALVFVCLVYVIGRAQMSGEARDSALQ